MTAQDPTAPARSSLAMPAWALPLRPTETVLAKLVQRVTHGRITVVTPDGRRIAHQGRLPGPEAELHLRRWRALRRTLLQGDIGLANAYIDGDLDSPDLTALLALLDRNADAIGALGRGWLAARLLRRLRHLARPNSPRGSRRNIVAHYDLGNAFYERWLDDGMQYSSALFTEPAQSLEQAQEAKLDRVLALMDARPGQRVLEIGCGWGALAERLARLGCDVTAVTLSPAQLASAKARIAAAGLADRVELRLQDYRELTGSFERIVSIEMVEAVGQAYWPDYFATLKSHLAQGGNALLQAITIAEERFDAYAADADFIQHMVFPGGMLPSRRALADQAGAAGLAQQHQETFGASYAATLALWRQRFQAGWAEIAPLGFDEAFRRLWTFYLCYCEAGFRNATVDVGFYRLAHASPAGT